MDRNVVELVEEYSMLRDKSKTIKGRMDSLSKQIKEYLTSNATQDSKGSYYSETDNYVVGNQAKKTIKLNEDRAKEFFLNKGLLEQVTDTKVVLNEDKIEQLLSQGLITADDIESIIDTKVTYSIDIKQKTKEEEPVEIQTSNSTKPSKRKLPQRRS